MADVFFRGVAARVLRDYMEGGERWLLVETTAGLRFSWLASEARGVAAPTSHHAGARTMAVGAGAGPGTAISVNGRLARCARCGAGAPYLEQQGQTWICQNCDPDRPTGIRFVTMSAQTMASDRNGHPLQVGDWVMLPDQQTRVIRRIDGDELTVENNGNGWMHVVAGKDVAYHPVAMSRTAMAATAEDRDGRAVHVGDSVQVPGAPQHPLHKVVAIGDGGYLTLRPAAGGALVEMPAREVVARLFGGGSPSHVAMAGAAAQDKNGAGLAVGDRVRTPYDEVGIIQRISVENGRVVVWTDMGQENEVSRGIVGWNAAGLAKVFARATTMANEAAKNIALPSGWQWTNGAAEFVFPMESGRYLVTRYMADQSPSTEDEGTFDLITAALRHADSLVPHNADAAYVWDRKRGFMVARRRA